MVEGLKDLGSILTLVEERSALKLEVRELRRAVDVADRLALGISQLTRPDWEIPETRERTRVALQKLANDYMNQRGDKLLEARDADRHQR